MKSLKCNNKGFTLIEVAVVVLILSFLLVPLFNFMTQQKMQEDAMEAEVVNERVLAAIAIYFKNNGHYPCPADPTRSYGDAGFGVARTTCANTATIEIGDVPFATLGIPFRLITNKAGWRYTYAVTEKLATTAANFDNNGIIRVLDDGGGDLLDGGFAQFIVVNHGKDGKGARNINGTASSYACSGGLDAENCDGDAIFVDAPAAPLSDPTDGDYYDDIVFYDLAREESTMWMMSSNGAGGMDIINRNAGKVGIGVSGGMDPDAKLEVGGGDVRVTGGDVAVNQSVRVGNRIYATSEVQAGQAVRANRFVYDTPTP